VFTLTVSDFVMIAHSLAGEFFGPAQRVHGATLGVEAELCCASLDEHGVVVDIGVFRSTLRQVLDGIDYQNLDQHPGFPPRGSTTERIAQYLCQELLKALPGLPTAGTLKVLLRESPVAWVSYEQALS
jgi:6-pyruvoyltetrahydropterin/6-carboxytetrahydropterin synthase